jgi:hypothetical protein
MTGDELGTVRGVSSAVESGRCLDPRNECAERARKPLAPSVQGWHAAELGPLPEDVYRVTAFGGEAVEPVSDVVARHRRQPRRAPRPNPCQAAPAPRLARRGSRGRRRRARGRPSAQPPGNSCHAITLPVRTPVSWSKTWSSFCSDACRSAEKAAPLSSSSSRGVADGRGTVPSPPGSSPPILRCSLIRSPSRKADCWVGLLDANDAAEAVAAQGVGVIP